MGQKPSSQTGDAISIVELGHTRSKGEGFSSNIFTQDRGVSDLASVDAAFLDLVVNCLSQCSRSSFVALVMTWDTLYKHKTCRMRNRDSFSPFETTPSLKNIAWHWNDGSNQHMKQAANA